MPTYLLHGFRWPRPLIRARIIIHNLEDCASEWIMSPTTSRSLRQNLSTCLPEIMEHLPDLRFIEQHDAADPRHESSPSQPFAYVADVVHEVKLGVDVDEVRGRGLGNERWEAMLDLRDVLAPGEKAGWWVVVCGVDDIEREAMPMVKVLENNGAYAFGGNMNTKTNMNMNINGNMTNGGAANGGAVGGTLINGATSNGTTVSTANTNAGLNLMSMNESFCPVDQSINGVGPDGHSLTLKKSKSKFSKFFTREKTIKKTQSNWDLSGSRPSSKHGQSPVDQKAPPLPRLFSYSSTNLILQEKRPPTSMPAVPALPAALTIVSTNESSTSTAVLPNTNGTSSFTPPEALLNGNMYDNANDLNHEPVILPSSFPSAPSLRTSPITTWPALSSQDNTAGTKSLTKSLRSGTSSKDTTQSMRHTRSSSQGNTSASGTASRESSPILPMRSSLVNGGASALATRNGPGSGNQKVLPAQQQQQVIAAATAAVIAASRPLTANATNGSRNIISYGHSRDNSGSLLQNNDDPLSLLGSTSKDTTLPRLVIPMLNNKDHAPSIQSPTFSHGLYSPAFPPVGLHSPTHSHGMQSPALSYGGHSSQSQASSSQHSPIVLQSPSGPSPTKKLPPLPPSLPPLKGSSTWPSVSKLAGKELPMRSSSRGSGEEDLSVEDGGSPSGMF